MTFGSRLSDPSEPALTEDHKKVENISSPSLLQFIFGECEPCLHCIVVFVPVCQSVIKKFCPFSEKMNCSFFLSSICGTHECTKNVCQKNSSEKNPST